MDSQCLMCVALIFIVSFSFSRWNKLSKMKFDTQFIPRVLKKQNKIHFHLSDSLILQFACEKYCERRKNLNFFCEKTQYSNLNKGSILQSMKKLKKKERI